MKVLLKKDVRKVGKAGDVVEVSDGYGAHYLIPNGYGVLYTVQAVKEREQELKAQAQERAEKTAAAQKVAEQLKTTTFTFEANVGNRGAMIGTISVKELRKALRDKLGVSVEKDDFIEHNLVNAFGLSHVKVRLYKDVIGIMNVVVNPKNQGK